MHAGEEDQGYCPSSPEHYRPPVGLYEQEGPNDPIWKAHFTPGQARVGWGYKPHLYYHSNRYYSNLTNGAASFVRLGEDNLRIVLGQLDHESRKSLGKTCALLSAAVHRATKSTVPKGKRFVLCSRSHDLAYKPSLLCNIVVKSGKLTGVIVRSLPYDGMAARYMVAFEDPKLLAELRIKEIEVVRPSRRDKVLIIKGEWKGSTGTLIGIDDTDGIVRMDENSDIKIILLNACAKRSGGLAA